MLVTSPDGKHLQWAASHKPFCKASRRAECGKSACSVRRGGGWKPAYGSVSEALPEETGSTPSIGPMEYGAIPRPYQPRGVLRERFLALEGEGITWTGQPSRQGSALFLLRRPFS